MADSAQVSHPAEGKAAGSNTKRQDWLRNSNGKTVDDYESPLDMLLLTSMPPKTQSECMDLRLPTR